MAEWDRGASVGTLPPSQARSGREMSSLPGIELPIKKIKQTKKKKQTPNLVEILINMYQIPIYMRGYFIMVSALIQEHMSLSSNLLL